MIGFEPGHSGSRAQAFNHRITARVLILVVGESTAEHFTLSSGRSILLRAIPCDIIKESEEALNLYLIHKLNLNKDELSLAL